MNNTAKIQTASAGEISMEYAVFGQGEKTMVIIPGLSLKSIIGSAQQVADGFASFAEEYTVYLFDRRKNLKAGCTVRDLAEDTAQIMKSLGIEKAYIFGASQGGMISQFIAIDHPELVEKLVLCSTTSRIDANVGSAASIWQKTAETGDMNMLIDQMLELIYSENTLKLYKDVLVSSFGEVTQEETDRFLIQAKANDGYSTADELKKIQCKTLVVGAEGDKIIPAAAIRELAEKTGAQLYMYGPEYGHGVYDEAPDYRDRLYRFFQED